MEREDIKVASLAGGKGTRLAEETEVKPKPMVTIGGQPILWHIMKHYAYYGHKDFYIALGYKGVHRRHSWSCTSETRQWIRYELGNRRRAELWEG